jgi:hypothetical protein
VLKRLKSLSLLGPSFCVLQVLLAINGYHNFSRRTLLIFIQLPFSADHHVAQNTSLRIRRFSSGTICSRLSQPRICVSFATAARAMLASSTAKSAIKPIAIRAQRCLLKRTAVDVQFVTKRSRRLRGTFWLEINF